MERSATTTVVRLRACGTYAATEIRKVVQLAVLDPDIKKLATLSCAPSVHESSMHGERTCRKWNRIHSK